MRNVYALLLSFCLSVVSFKTAVASSNQNSDEQSTPQSKSVPGCTDWEVVRKFSVVEIGTDDYRGHIKSVSVDSYIDQIIFCANKKYGYTIDVFSAEYIVSNEYDLIRKLISDYVRPKSWGIVNGNRIFMEPGECKECHYSSKSKDSWLCSPLSLEEWLTKEKSIEKWAYSRKEDTNEFLTLFVKESLIPLPVAEFITDHLNNTTFG